MGWLRSLGSIKLQVSFAEYLLFYRILLQKRPVILSMLSQMSLYTHNSDHSSYNYFSISVQFFPPNGPSIFLVTIHQVIWPSSLLTESPGIIMVFLVMRLLNSSTHCSVRKGSFQDNVIRGTFKVSLTLSRRSPEQTPTKPNDLLGCCSKPRLSNRPQMPPPSRHVDSGGSYLFSSRLLNLGFEPVGASPSRVRVLERVTGG